MCLNLVFPKSKDYKPTLHLINYFIGIEFPQFIPKGFQVIIYFLVFCSILKITIYYVSGFDKAKRLEVTSIENNYLLKSQMYKETKDISYVTS